MKYIKEFLLTTLLLTTGYSQCDANGDGDLDVLYVVIEVDCILTDCWGGEPVSEVEDVDGNCYETVQIGDQLWMAENLKVTHYNNGDEIPNITNDDDWGSFTEQFSVYDNDPVNADIYGNLYNWAVINDERGVCPTGFHVPSDEEFMELEMFLGMSEEEANSTGYRGTNEGSKLAGNSDLWFWNDCKQSDVIGQKGLKC